MLRLASFILNSAITSSDDASCAAWNIPKIFSVFPFFFSLWPPPAAVLCACVFLLLASSSALAAFSSARRFSTISSTAARKDRAKLQIQEKKDLQGSPLPSSLPFSVLPPDLYVSPYMRISWPTPDSTLLIWLLRPATRGLAASRNLLRRRCSGFMAGPLQSSIFPSSPMLSRESLMRMNSLFILFTCASNVATSATTCFNEISADAQQATQLCANCTLSACLARKCMSVSCTPVAFKF
mmetsp:Transcript_29423/g.49636  ORF Transcript_29423/g.49636 Transcript_29423/m.49636 type:complete len:239 (+) Transcript_29423:343-1059(+)